MTHAERRARNERVAEMARAGIEDKDIAEAVGLSIWTVAQYRATNGVKHQRGCSTDLARATAMRDAFARGQTFQEIGDTYAVSRQRVQQILDKHFHVSRNDGGQSIRAFLAYSRATPQSALEARCLVCMGCSRSAYRELTGNTYRSKDCHADRFQSQRSNARKRGIEFTLTFREWWAIWQASGHYAQRGRGKGYVMARIGDTGGYSVGNVMICTMSQNAHDQYFSGKPRKVAITVRAPRRDYADAYIPANALGMSA